MSLGLGGPTTSQLNSRVSDGTNAHLAGMSGTVDSGVVYGVHGAYNPIPVTETHSVLILGDGVSETTGTAGTIPATIPPQELSGSPYFGIRAQNAFSPNWGIRNLYVWQFDTDRADIAQLVAWIAANPGRIPPQLIGK